MIDIVTFTGIDRRTPLETLIDLSRRYPRVEFGILVGSHTGEAGLPIFPDMRVVDELREVSKSGVLQTSIHLCGKFARMVMGENGPDKSLYPLCEGFDRVQVNLHGDTFMDGGVKVKVSAVKNFADNVDCDSVILQHRGTSWDDVPVVHDKVEYLFDRSEGRGLESFQDWPPPSSDFPRTGYAGGLGPHNIKKAIEFADRHAEHALWFDMGGRIRSGRWLDTDAVQMVCNLIWGERGVEAGG